MRSPLVHSSIIVGLLVALTLAAGDTGAQGLTTPKAKKALVKCQAAIAQGGAKLVASRLKTLQSCSAGALKCVQTVAPPAACLAKLGSGCDAAFQAAFPKLETAFTNKVLK